MQTKIAVLALFGAPLLLMPLTEGPAEAASAPAPINALGSTTSAPALELVRNGGGGGGHFGGGFGGGGGGAPHLSGSGGAPHFSGGAPHVSDRTFAGQGGGATYHAHPYSGPHPYTGRRYANRVFDHGGRHGHYGNRNNRHYAERRYYHGHSYRHRVWRNGAWVWVYGPGYYYGPDYYAYGGECYWLRQQAYATGSPYWWSRYNACLGYY